jgi:hyaluronoglucosaminidase
LVLTASGTPAGSFVAAVDGDPSTAYAAAAAPTAGDALTVTASAPAKVDRVTVLQRDGATGNGRLEIKTAAGWQPVGPLTGSYTAAPVADQQIEAVRVVWSPGTVAPQVAEVILHRTAG